MEKKIDYEQLYYDSQYEIKQLKKRIIYLEDLVHELNNSGSNKNINLQMYLVNELSRFQKKKEKNNGNTKI